MSVVQTNPREDRVRGLILEPEFHAGLLAGLAGLFLVVGLRAAAATRAAVLSKPKTKVTGTFGPVLVLCTIVVVGGTGPFTQVQAISARTGVGLLVLWVAGQAEVRMGGSGPDRQIIAGCIAVFGGILLVDPRADLPGWGIALVAIGPALGGAAAASLDRRGRHSGTGPLLLGVATVALYLTVPDTELALVLLGVSTPLMLTAWPRPVARLGDGGAYAAVGLFIWMATSDGVGRPGSTVGAVAALGVLVVEPLGRMLSQRLPIVTTSDNTPTPRRRVASTWTLIAAQIVAAAWASRVAGSFAAPGTALIFTIPSVIVALAVTTRYRPSDPVANPP